MISKLPRWVEIGGFILALIAGSVNAIGLLGFKHQAVSHLTGTSTLLGLELANWNLAESFHLCLVIIFFVIGAALSGFIIEDSALKLGRRYGAALLIEALLLVLAMFALHQGSTFGHLLASAACGLQNAITSTYSGAVIRTTHVSGLFTDIGIMLGGVLRGGKTDRRKVLLYLYLISGFILGGTLGSIAYQHMEFNALLIPAGLTLSLSLAYISFTLHPNSK